MLLGNESSAFFGRRRGKGNILTLSRSLEPFACAIRIS
jgi:hypothetical protein